MPKQTAVREGRLNILNRNEFHCFVPSPTESYKTKTRIKALRFKRFSHDKKYKDLKENGQNIDIVSDEILVNGQKPIDGIFSPLFGADSTQDTPIYTCDCHELTGGANKGRICPKCHTEVRTIEADLRLQGHIDISPYHILSFHGWVALSKIIKNLDEVINTTYRITKSGAVAKTDIPTLMDLYDDYKEVYEPLTGIPRSIAFMSKIPVYSSRLRPLMLEHVNLSMLDVNSKYLSIVHLMRNLKSAEFIQNVHRDIEIQRTLNQLQRDFNEICKIVLDQINGKEGVFRHALTSGRLDYSSRLVITLGTDLMAHEIDLPYQCVVVQYEEVIANYYSKLMDVPLAKAISYVNEHSLKPDPILVKIMNQMLRDKNGTWVLVNRNPTISEYGIQLCRIRSIHEDSSDLTCHLGVDGLSNLNADFDGDVISSLVIHDPRFVKLFMTMCPTYAFIDRADGRFNRFMDFKKDYLATISYAWDIDSAIDRYLMDSCEETYRYLDHMGLLDSAGAEGFARSQKFTRITLSNDNDAWAARHGGHIWPEDDSEADH